MDKIYTKNTNWENKQKEIFARDNFTCQHCLAFNPSLGPVSITNPDDSNIEIHEYEYFNSSIYRITSFRFRFTLEIDFGPDRLIFPVLQVFPKITVENIALCDYERSELTTLCRNCLYAMQTYCEKSIFDSLLLNCNLGIFLQNKLDNDFNNSNTWTFTRMDSLSNYEVCKIRPQLRYYLPFEKINQVEEIKNIAHSMLVDFYKRYLPAYLIKELV